MFCWLLVDTGKDEFFFSLSSLNPISMRKFKAVLQPHIPRKMGTGACKGVLKAPVGSEEHLVFVYLRVQCFPL